MAELKKRRVDALTVKSGPTESGNHAAPIGTPVGGDVFQVDKLSIFLSQYGLLILILSVTLGFVLYKKRNRIYPFVTRFLSRFGLPL